MQIFADMTSKFEVLLQTGLQISSWVRLRQGAVDGAEGVADFGSEQAHDCNDDDGDESEDDGVLDQTLTFFLGSK